MNIYITRGNRTGKPFLLSVADKSILAPGQEVFETNHTSDLVTGFHCVCTQEVFSMIVDKVGTLEAPALIANSSATPYAGRVNCYIENGSLKILA